MQKKNCKYVSNLVIFLSSLSLLGTYLYRSQDVNIILWNASSERTLNSHGSRSHHIPHDFLMDLCSIILFLQRMIYSLRVSLLPLWSIMKHWWSNTSYFKGSESTRENKQTRKSMDLLMGLKLVAIFLGLIEWDH